MHLDSSSQEEAEPQLGSGDDMGLAVRFSPIDPREEWEPEEELRLASESLARNTAQALWEALGANHAEYLRLTGDLVPRPPGVGEISLCLQAWDGAYTEADLNNQKVSATALADVLESIGSALEMSKDSQSVAGKELLARTVQATTAVLAESISASARCELWSLVLKLRGRYFRWWNHGYAMLDQTELSSPHEIWRKKWIRRIGEQVGDMHAKGIVHGTALLESFDSGARVGNFARTKYNSSSEARLGDLISFRHQVSRAEWNEFCDGYRQRSGDENDHLLVTADQHSADTERLDTIRGITLPVERLPAFCVRALTYALRNFPELESLLDGLQSADQDTQDSNPDVQGIISSLQRSFGLAECVTRAAAARLLSYVMELYTNGECVLAEEVAAKAFREAGHTLSAEEKIRLNLYLQLSRAPEGSDAAAGAMAQAAASLIQLGEPDSLQSAIGIAYSAIGKSQTIATRGACVFACVEGLLKQAGPLGNPAPLRAILDVTALALDLTAEAQETLNKFEDVARRLLALQPDLRRQAYQTADFSLAASRLVEELKDAIVEGVPGNQSEGVDHVPEQVGIRIDAEDWNAAAPLLRHELERPGAHLLRDARSIRCAAVLCSVLQQLRDFEPHRRVQLAVEVNDLVGRLSPVLLDANGETAMSPEARSSLANIVGFAAVNAAGDLAGDPGTRLLNRGIDLMELSTSLLDEALDSKGFSFSANNLAVGYQFKARRQDDEGARESLQHAVELIQRVIKSDERLAESHNAYERSVSRTKYIDLLNLGLVCRDLGDRTYSRMMISVKPKESAVFYRRAIRAFVDSRDLAAKRRHTTIAATASNSLAALLLSICQTFVAERQWAGGDINAAYYDWLSTLADGPVGTARLFQTCTVAALRSASSAARAQHTNSALIVECVDTMIAVFSLSQRKLAFGTGLRQDALIAILEVLETLPGRLDEEVSRSQIGDLTALVSLLESLLRVELFTSGCGSLKQLQAARGTFLNTAEHGRLVERAIARPYSRWLDVMAEANGLLANGLYVGNSDFGLEFRIPSQRRSLELRGIISHHLDCRIQSVSWLETISGLATAHMEPQLNLEDVPFCIATTRADVLCNGERLTLSACRLPTASWDSWAMTLDRTGSRPVSFAVSFPFLGLYDIASKTLDRALPCSLTTSSQVLLFGNPGVVFELAFPLSTSTETAIGSVTVGGNVNSPEIRLDSASLSLVLKTAPHITTGDVAYFVKDEPSASGAALCSSGVLPSVSPSLSLPSTVLHSFSPLFFFDKEPDRAGLDIINRFDMHEIVLVGIPESREATDAALEALFDPRRELFLLVDASELELANAAITRLRGQVYQSLAGRRLLASAASSNGYFEAFSNIQLIVVPRSLAPAASQMLLDLAAVRRATIEGRPILEGDRVCRLNVKGNIVGSRRMATLFPLGTTLDTLTERYVDKSAESQKERIVYHHVTDPAMFDLLAGRIGKRPVVIFQPDDETSPALAPFIRHTGAIPVPASADGFALLERLAPEKVYAQRSLHPAVPNGSWHLEELPSDSGELALHFQQVVRRDHGTLLETLEATHPSLISSRALLEEALPADYAVVSITSAKSRPWSYLAANYAAALGSPILLIPQNAPPCPAEELPASLLQGTDLRSLSDPDLERHFLAVERSLQRDQSALSKAGDGSIAALRPVYIGVVCERPDIAIELAGVPPLATRVAIGRLAGPDLISTSILITRAALSENVERTSILEALVMEAADAVPEKPLPGALREAEAVFGSLQGARGVHPKLLLKVKRTDFLRGLANAQIVHFAGHGMYRDGDPAHSGLIVTDGIIAVSDLTLPLAGEPLVFSNACESGVLSNQADAGRAWSGLAAAFINAGAVNYLGSLWPISDARSQRLAESFYKDLLGKCATGEALRRARVAAFDRRDSTWAAYVLFGCPRTRLYASD